MNTTAATEYPLARAADLVIQEVPGETLVYDLNSHRAHCLNQSAADVWRACDGKTPVDEIVRLLAGEGITSDHVWLAIDMLNESDLLENKPLRRYTGNTRRQVIKKIGLAAATAAPVIASIVALPATRAGNVSTCACVVPANCNTQAGCLSLVNCNGNGICAP